MEHHRGCEGFSGGGKVTHIIRRLDWKTVNCAALCVYLRILRHVLSNNIFLSGYCTLCAWLNRWGDLACQWLYLFILEMDQKCTKTTPQISLTIWAGHANWRQTRSSVDCCVPCFDSSGGNTAQNEKINRSINHQSWWNMPLLTVVEIAIWCSANRRGRFGFTKMFPRRSVLLQNLSLGTRVVVVSVWFYCFLCAGAW